MTNNAGTAWYVATVVGNDSNVMNCEQATNVLQIRKPSNINKLYAACVT